MKFSFFLFFIFSLNIQAQRVDVLLVGVSHDYKNYPPQDFTDINRNIRKFKPTAFFGEFLSKKDEQNLMDYWCKQENVQRLETLRKNKNIPSEKLSHIIDSLKTLLLQHPEDNYLKTDLAHGYYLDQDVSNGHYQFWQVYSSLKQSPNVALETYVDKILSPNLDVKGRSMTRLKTSEYALIAFPMMQELGIKELYPMDCQDYDLNWSASSVAFHNKFESYAKDSAAAYSAKLKEFVDKRTEGFEKYKSMGLTSHKVTEWLNTDEASAILSSGDFYFTEMYDLPNFPKEEMNSQLHWWIMRNQKMCENAVNRARNLGARKIVVFAGANHRKYMQEIFAKMPKVTVINVNEVKN